MEEKKGEDRKKSGKDRGERGVEKGGGRIGRRERGG